MGRHRRERMARRIRDPDYTTLQRIRLHLAEADGTAEQRFVTVYQPRRPRLTPLAVGVLALAASAWLTIQVLIPAYQGAGQAGISRSERAVEVHDLTVAAALVAIALVVAVSCIGVWVGRYCPIPASTFVVPPRCQPIDSGDRVRPPTQPRDRGNVDPAAPQPRPPRPAGGSRCSWNGPAAAP